MPSGARNQLLGLDREAASGIVDNGHLTSRVLGEVNLDLVADCGVVKDGVLSVSARNNPVRVFRLDLVGDLGLGHECGCRGLKVHAGRIGSSEANEPVVYQGG